MGGLGKTRLSLQIAADMMDAFPDGVWFIDLAPIRDESLVPSVTAQVLGVQEEPGRSLTETLCAHLKPRKLFLIFDNCEHLVGASATLANALLRAAPDVRMIATTREALRVPGEQTYPVFPLAVPDRAANVATLSRSDAVQLFMDRAQLQKPGFMLTEKEAPAVAELVGRLEGIPLALELAAARMRALSIQDINKRLDDRFKLLTGGGRVLLERQQTLRALVAWSYDILQENEQRLLERLSVFVGGFDLDAAEAVCGADPLTSDDVLDLLTSLVEKSLVMTDESESSARYKQLETIRDFAREYLIKRDDAADIEVRHCNHYFVMAKAANTGIQGPEQAEWTKRIEAELDNLRAGINLSLEGRTDPFIAIKFEVALMGFRMFRGYSGEGRKYIRAALALPAVQASDLARAYALYVGGVLADDQSDYAEARNMLEQCLTLHRGLGEPINIAGSLSSLAQVRLRQGDAESARDYEEEALALFRQLGARIEEAISIGHLGDICMYLSEDDEARKHYEQCLAIARATSNHELEGECERMLGEIMLERGDLSAARTQFTRSLEVCKAAEDKRGEVMALWGTGKADAAGGDSDAARAKLAEALRAFKAFEMNAQVLGCLEDHARLMQSLGRTDAAVRLYATVESFRERRALKRPPRTVQRWTHAIAAARAELGDAAFDAAWADGRALELDGAIRFALEPVDAARVTA